MQFHLFLAIISYIPVHYMHKYLLKCFQAYINSISEIQTNVVSTTGNPELFLSDVLGSLPIHVFNTQ